MTYVACEVLADIFGNKEGPTFFQELVDCKSEDEFDSKLRKGGKDLNVLGAHYQMGS